MKDENWLPEHCIDIVADNGQAGHEVDASGGGSGMAHEYDIKPERLNDPVIYESRHYQQDTVRDACVSQLKIQSPHGLTSSLLAGLKSVFTNYHISRVNKRPLSARCGINCEYGHDKKKAWGRKVLPHARCRLIQAGLSETDSTCQFFSALGDGHTDEVGEDERAESRPRACPTKHLRALSGRIREHYRVLTEGSGVGYACHQEYPEHDINEARECLEPGRRKIAAEYEGRAADDQANEAPEHAFAAAPLVKYGTSNGAGKTADKRAEEGILKRVRRTVEAAVDDLDHHREGGRA